MPTAAETSSYRHLLDEKARLFAEGKALHTQAAAEKRGLFEDEKKRDDDINTRLDALADDIARAERMRERERATGGSASGLNSDAWAGHTADGDDHYPITTKPRNPTGGPFGSFGEQLEAIYLAAMQGDPRSSEARQRLDKVHDYHQDKFRAAAGDMTATSPSDGGFLVQTDFASEIIRRMYAMGSILQQVRRLPLGPNSDSLEIPFIDETSRATGSRWGAVSGYWVGEQTAPTASNPKLGKITLTLNEVAALGYATNRLLRDARAVSELYTQAFAEELTWLAENAIIRGTGAGQPQGLVGFAATISIAKETGQAAATLAMENLSKLWARLYARSRANAVWYVNQDVEPQMDLLAKVIGTAGVEPNFVTYGPDGLRRIKGRPVVAIEYCSTIGTVGDIILADLSQYVVIEKGGIDQAQSMHVRFTTNEMAFRAIYSIDGEPMWRSALTPANGSNTLSPYLTLATRS